MRYSEQIKFRRICVLFAESLASGTTALGSSNDIAKRCGVSLPTIARTIASLKKAGIVTGGRGRALRIVPDAARAYIAFGAYPTARTKAAAWEAVCGRLEDDIRSGTFRAPAPFPSMKELTARYGASFRTVRRALSDLCERSILLREGVGYGLPSVSGNRRRGEIVLIARGGETHDRHEPIILYERTQVMLHRLDELCEQAGVQLTSATMYYQGLAMVPSPQLAEILSQPQRRKNILGFVLWPVSLAKEFAVDLVERHLRSFGLPVAVFDDEDRLLPRELALNTNGLIGFFSLVNQRAAGREAGRYAAQCGHRSAVFISNGSDDYWVQERYEGFRDAFLPRRGGGTVVCIQPQIEESPGTPVAQSGPDDDGYFALRTITHAHEVLEYRRALSKAIAPLLAAHLERQGISLIAGANDEIALVCMDILISNGFRPGADISVLGFDNSFESSACRLTSYDFNEPALVDAMVHHVLDRRWISRFRDAGPTLSVAGRLIERESSRKSS